MSVTALKSTNWSLNFWFFGLVPKSPIHTGLIYVKTSEPNISSLGPFKKAAWERRLRHRLRRGTRHAQSMLESATCSRMGANSSWNFSFFISFANFSEVTRLLANVMKAISSLLPFRSYMTSGQCYEGNIFLIALPFNFSYAAVPPLNGVPVFLHVIRCFGVKTDSSSSQ